MINIKVCADPALYPDVVRKERRHPLLRMIALALFAVLALFSKHAYAFEVGEGDHEIGSLKTGSPMEVAVGVEIDQITFIDQKSENFGAVATVRMYWTDSLLSFDALDYGRDYKILGVSDFVGLAERQRAVVPFFVYGNQQGQRWRQEALVTVYSDGSVQFVERSTLQLQAPYFDFTRYPFDTQQFFVEIVSVNPNDTVRYTVLSEHTGLGDNLGEEAWILENPIMAFTKVKGLSGLDSAQATLGFLGHRHLQYYFLRIFGPMIVLVLVSWATFFLDDFRKRIDISGANLLVFVAFNFTISDSLPQLGYLTFMDFVLQMMFVVTGAVVVFNVALRRLVIMGREALARSIDNYVVKWVFPLGYVGVVAFAVYQFLLKT